MKKVYFLFLILLFNTTLYSQNKEYKKFFYPSGQLSSEGTLLDGKPDGLWKSYYPNGIVKSEGKWLVYLKDQIRPAEVNEFLFKQVLLFVA